MKLLLFFSVFFASIELCGQTEEIYKITFSNKSNFNLTNSLQHKMPHTFFIIDTTETWNSNRFWLSDFENVDKQKAIKEIKDDEHHPYFHTYLFSDTSLEKIFSDNSKRNLCSESKKLKHKQIKLSGLNYRTISSSKNVKGFYFVTSEPLFTSDKKFAFIDITVYYKDNYKQSLNETYFGTICIVYQKQKNDNWKRIAKKDWLIL